MGEKIKTRIIQNIILLGVLFLALSSFAAGEAGRRTNLTSLTIESDYRLSPVQLTTDRVGALDFRVKNPHRRKWIVIRNAALEQIIVGGSRNQFGIRAAVIRVGSEGHVRGPGPWYLTAGEQELARQEAADGAELWLNLLNENRVQLEVQFRKIRAGSEGLAKAMALHDFQDWIDKLDVRWRKETSVDAHASWGNVRMEPVVSKLDPSLLARAPVRLWDRGFSVRASVKIGESSLSGRFLIDPHLNRSVISPYWMENQGFSNLWAIIPNLPPVSVSDEVLWKGKSRLGRPAWIESVEVSGMKLDLHQFLLLESDFFAPPRYAINCCDGVLGADFLSLYPIEFDRRPPAEVRIWSKPLFFQQQKKPGVPKTPSPELLEWKEISQEEDGSVVGLPDLEQLEHYTIDLPHGRFWYQPVTRSPAGNESSRTRPHPIIETEFYMDHGERGLRVTKLSAGQKEKAVLAELVAKGFATGLEITKIDSVAVDEYDQWQVDELLAPSAAKKPVLIEWKTKKEKLLSSLIHLSN